MTGRTSRSMGGMDDAVPENAPAKKAGWVTRVAVGAAVLAVAGSGALAVAPNVFAASSAPTQGTTTCATAGDECSNAIAYANANDGGGANVLAVEADTEAHGGTVTRRVFDVRLQTNNGVYVEHVFRNDNAPSSDGVWWQSRAENQNPSGSSTSAPPSNSGGSSADNSPDASTSIDASSPDTSPDQPASQGASGSSPASDSPQISANQAASDATSFVTSQGYQVLGVKHDQLKSSGQKDYYQVKLQLGQNGRKHGTTNVWVDATSSPGTVTAASGSGLDFRDASIVSPGTAQGNAVSATGGGTAYKTQINGGEWRWYWVFVRDGSARYKVGVAAATGKVTQVRHS